MFKNILLPTDGSDYSLTASRYAIELARLYGATIHGLSVVNIKLTQGQFIADLSNIVRLDASQLEEVLQDKGLARLDKLKEACEDAGVACKTSNSMGIVGDSICRKARIADLIVMGKYGESGKWAGPLLGSVAETVVRQADKPVLLVSKEYQTIDRILIAYDSGRSANYMLHFAADLAMNLKVPITVLAVTDDLEKGLPILEEAQFYLEAYKVDVDLLLKDGEPAEEILFAAKDSSVSLIAMGAYGHNIREFILGSITEHVMREAPCPVLLYRY
jgi:nucleotide-binding universal stress UspA family protein